jgi:hypothetical protein
MLPRAHFRPIWLLLALMATLTPAQEPGPEIEVR